MMQSHQTAPRLCKNDGQEHLRAVALAEIDSHLDNLKRCIHWMVASGIVILGVDMRRGRHSPTIEVAPSPWLHILFREDCANVGRRQEGALTIYTWAASRHGCAIRWEEMSA